MRKSIKHKIRTVTSLFKKFPIEYQNYNNLKFTNIHLKNELRYFFLFEPVFPTHAFFIAFVLIPYLCIEVSYWLSYHIKSMHENWNCVISVQASSLSLPSFLPTCCLCLKQLCKRKEQEMLRYLHWSRNCLTSKQFCIAVMYVNIILFFFSHLIFPSQFFV